MKQIKKEEKKKYLIRGSILLLVGIVGLIFGIYSVTHKEESTETQVTDAEKFKNEYESLNGKTNDNNKEYVHIEINKDNPIKYVTFNEVMDILDSGTGIIYFGFPECPWCRNAVPVLLDSAEELGINEIYYFNALEMRDIKELNENGEVVTTKEGTDEYKKLYDKLYDYLDVYSGLNDDSIKRLYFPTVFFIQNGNVEGKHMGTVDSQEDPYIVLNTEQRNELKKIYSENINKIYNYECNDGC